METKFQYVKLANRDLYVLIGARIRGGNKLTVSAIECNRPKDIDSEKNMEHILDNLEASDGL
jgi:hypothetical protein